MDVTLPGRTQGVVEEDEELGGPAPIEQLEVNPKCTLGVPRLRVFLPPVV